MSNTFPREIAFDEIRKGDRIRFTELGGGVTYTCEGVTHTFQGECWEAQEGGPVASKTDDTITLLDRPTTPLPTEEGALILAYCIRGLTFDKPLTLRRNNRGRWVEDGGWVNEAGDDVLSWAPLTPGPAVVVVSTPAEIPYKKNKQEEN